MQVIVMTSDSYLHSLKPFAYLFNKYWGYRGGEIQEVIVCGFTKPPFELHENFIFHSIGKYEDYPADKWSDALIKVLDNVAEEQFVLMLEDYWITRAVDHFAVRMLADYCKQFKNVLKICLSTDRLYINGGSNFLYGANTYNHVGYVDLIKSPPGTMYQMSLWGGLWNRDVMRKFIIPGERAQEIEMRGTNRVNELGDSFLVLGTRQAPVLHGNIYQSGKVGPSYADIGWRVNQADLNYILKQGWIDG